MAVYYDLVMVGERLENAAWCYENPRLPPVFPVFLELIFKALAQNPVFACCDI